MTLPVTQLNFGDVSKENGEKGKSTLGPLKCKWDIGYPVPSCEALEKSGVTQSGDYMVSGYAATQFSAPSSLDRLIRLY